MENEREGGKGVKGSARTIPRCFDCCFCFLESTGGMEGRVDLFTFYSFRSQGGRDICHTHTHTQRLVSVCLSVLVFLYQPYIPFHSFLGYLSWLRGRGFFKKPHDDDDTPPTYLELMAVTDTRARLCQLHLYFSV